MSINIVCENAACCNPLRVKDDLAGRQIKCPNCGQVTHVPAPPAAATPAYGGNNANAGPQQAFVIDARMLSVVGLLFVVIAGWLTARELDLATGWLVALLLLGLAVAAELLHGFLRAVAVLVFALAGVITPIFYFLHHRDIHRDQPFYYYRDQPFYYATVVFLVLSIYLIVRLRKLWSQFDLRDGDKQALNLTSVSVWLALIVSSLAGPWATYFNFFTTLEDEYIERRLVFTLFLIAVGILCSVVGRKSPQPFFGIMGLTFLVVGVAKALAYDTTHLRGFLRIGVFAGGGVLLLLGGALLKKSQKQPGPTT